MALKTQKKEHAIHKKFMVASHIDEALKFLSHIIRVTSAVARSVIASSCCAITSSDISTKFYSIISTS